MYRSKHIFKFKNKEASVDFIKGVVMSAKRHSETSISSSGGGGYVGRYGGTVSRTKIHSNTVSVDNIWLKTEDGKEHHQVLRNQKSLVREGQEIVLTYFASQGRQAVLFGLINQTAGSYSQLNPVRNICSKIGLYDYANFFSFLGKLVGVFLFSYLIVFAFLWLIPGIDSDPVTTATMASMAATYLYGIFRVIARCIYYLKNHDIEQKLEAFMLKTLGSEKF